LRTGRSDEDILLVAKVKHKVVDGEGESEGGLGPEVRQAGRDTDVVFHSDFLHDTTKQHYYSKHRHIDIVLVSHGGFLADLTHPPKEAMTFRNCQWRTYQFSTKETINKGEKQKYDIAETDGSKHV
jgi:hypothetical protein